jgi:ribose transport system substrate-binding protein
MKLHHDSFPAPFAFRKVLIRKSAAFAAAALLFSIFLSLVSFDAFAQKEKTIAFIPGIASDPFFKAMELDARGEAKKLGINLIWQGSATDYSPQTQMPFVDAAFANGIDALILVPTDPDSLQSAVAHAQALSIPVITVDTTVKDQSYLTSYITGDNIDGGRKAASTLAEQIGGAGKVFIMSGSPSATTDTLREKGFREEITKYPKSRSWDANMQTANRRRQPLPSTLPC